MATRTEADFIFYGGRRMGKRATLLDRAIQTIDDKIAALQLAREHLLAERQAQPARKKRPAAVDVAAGPR